MNARLAILSLALGCGTAHAQVVYKCVEAGQTSYGSVPCAPGVAGEQIQMPPGSPTKGAASEQQSGAGGGDRLKALLATIEQRGQAITAEREALRQTWLSNHPDAPESIRWAVTYRQPAIGMDEEALRAALGHPDDRRLHTFPAGHTEWWHYERGSKRVSVHFTNGIVDSFHQ